MDTILLLLIAAASPWVVHLAPPRQRALALVGVVAVLLLYAIFARNPITSWELWVGLAAGLLTVLFAAGSTRSAPARRSSRARRGAAGSFDNDREPTGEI